MRKLMSFVVVVIVVLSLLVALPVPAKAQGGDQEVLVPVCILTSDAGWQVFQIPADFLPQILAGLRQRFFGIELFVVDAQHPCPPVKTRGFEGPGIPKGFVQGVEICDTEQIMDRPGGQPVGPVIKAGSTWYMNPNPVKDRKGDLWVEVFFGGWHNGWLERDCVRLPTDPPAR